MAASRALENAAGKIRPFAVISGDMPAAISPPQLVQPPKKGRWAAGLLGIVLIIVLIGIWGSMAPRSPRSVANAAGPLNGTESSTAPAPQFGGNDEPGVPLSADEFLLKHQR
jgi:hypothetical protein